MTKKIIYRISTSFEVWYEESNKFEMISRDLKAKLGKEKAMKELDRQHEANLQEIREYEVDRDG